MLIIICSIWADSSNITLYTLSLSLSIYIGTPVSSMAEQVIIIASKAGMTS